MFQFQNVFKTQNGNTYGEQHITLNMIHINQSIREQSANGNDQYEMKLTINTSTYLNLED
jgi:hypothetical protein